MSEPDTTRDLILPQALGDADLQWALLDHMEEGIYMVDPDRRILYWNVGAEQITGYRAMDVKGRFCQANLLMHCDVDGTALCGNGCPLAAVIEDGKSRECVVFLRHKQGHRVPVRVRARAIHDANHRVVGAVEVFEEAVPPARAQIDHLEGFGCCDELTGLANRAYGEMKLMQALQTLQRFGVPFGWLRIAMDDDGEMEHRYGHAFIDTALKVIAKTIDRNLGPFDVLIRWDRTEFRVVVHHCTNNDLLEIARKAVVLVRCSSVNWWGDVLRMTVSVGGALAGRGDSLALLEERANVAFAASRSAGGDCASVTHARSVEFASGNPFRIL